MRNSEKEKKSTVDHIVQGHLAPLDGPLFLAFRFCARNFGGSSLDGGWLAQSHRRGKFNGTKVSWDWIEGTRLR